MIILINGSMNAGKTTVAKILISKIPRCAHIEKLRQFIEWMPIEESKAYNIPNIVSLTSNFITIGDLNVVISYPMSSEKFLQFKNEMKDLDKEIFAFTLAPKLEVVTTNRGTRELKEWEVEQIKKTYDENFHQPDYGEIIDNSNQTPEETAQLILERIKL